MLHLNYSMQLLAVVPDLMSSWTLKPSESDRPQHVYGSEMKILRGDKATLIFTLRAPEYNGARASESESDRIQRPQ